MASLTEAMDIYRKVVSFVYREIGAMRPANHQVLYHRSLLPTPGLARTRKETARKLFCQTRNEADPEKVETAYRRVWGLSLEEVREAFQVGDWLLGGRTYSFGGPRWAAIASAAIQLRDSIRHGDAAAVADLLRQVPTLSHNNGLLVDKFPQLRCP